MKAFVIFTKKEFTESWRTYRFVIALAVFVLLGAMNPLIAKMMPEILSSIDTSGMEGMGGMSFNMPEPTAFDAWAQFYSNVGQMGLLTLIIVFSGVMAGEFTRGTLVNLLTKGLKRGTVILSKFAAATLFWAAVYLVCLGVSAALTAVFWDMELHNAVLAFGGMWLFGELLIALLIFGGTLFKTFYGSLALTAGVIIALLLLNIAPQAAKYNPISLAGETLALLNASKAAGDFVPAFIICAAAVAGLLAASVRVFEKKEL
jgi:ABC-2 type transport system permease protein